MRRAEKLLVGVFALLLLLVAAHAIGVCLDLAAAWRYPYQLDYGEGIVWQQALLIPSARMYSASQALPFIVFHYPPLYYLAVRALATIMPDMLSAGRLVSALSGLAAAALVAALVHSATLATDTATRRLHGMIALTAGLLVLCLHAVRIWSMLMRVDMLSVAFGLGGLLVASRSNGRFVGTTLALLLCLASVYTKQTQLPAGIAVFLVTLLRRPRAALGAGAVAGVVGLGALGLLEHVTAGGFLQNIIGDNVNRFDVGNAVRAVALEQESQLFAILMLAGAAANIRVLAGLRHADSRAATRAMLVLHFAFATLLLVSVLKSGGSYNYFLDWLSVGCPLLGILLCDLLARPRQAVLAATIALLGVLLLPWRELPDHFSQANLDRQSALVARIRAADRPVASEDMTLLMRAGKPVIFEPAIATELALVGRWDETPLVDMIRDHGFAFMITTDDDSTSTRRTPRVDAAMREAYPRVEEISPLLWVHSPQ